MKIKMVSDREKLRMNNMRAAGATPDEISKEMCISLKTIYKYLGGN